MRNTKDLPDLKHTAYHEAGHVVAAYTVRRAFKSVSIVEEEHSLGRVLFSNFEDAFFESLSLDSSGNLVTRCKLEKEVIVFYGGTAAVDLLTGELDVEKSEHDLTCVRELLTRASGDGDEAETYSNWLYARTKAMLCLPHLWHAVEAVAAALLENQTLSYRAARKIMCGAVQDSLQKHLRQMQRDG